MNKSYQQQWDPKYAALGVLFIAVAVVLSTIVPDLLMARVRKLAHRDDALPKE